MPDYRIFGDRRSGNCLKVKWTADLLDLAYEWVEIDVLKQETRTTDFLARNAAGQVPVLELPDGSSLSQSNAIVLYLLKSHGSPLVPLDDVVFAQVLQWLFWEQYSHEPAIAVRRFQKTYLGWSDDKIDPALLEKGNAALQVMENHLSRQVWFAGDNISAADIALVAYTRSAPEGGFDLSAYPQIEAWIGRTEAALGLPPLMEAS